METNHDEEISTSRSLCKTDSPDLRLSWDDMLVSSVVDHTLCYAGFTICLPSSENQFWEKGQFVLTKGEVSQLGMRKVRPLPSRS